MASRVPRRTRTQQPRAVPVTYFVRKPDTGRRQITRSMPQLPDEEWAPPDPPAPALPDEDTAVTDGEAPIPGRKPRQSARGQTGAGPEDDNEDDEDTEGDSHPSDFLVDVPAASEGRYHAGRVAQLLQGQKAGHPFPPLTGEDIVELARFGRYLFEESRLQDAQAVLEALVASSVMDAFPYSMLGTVYLAQRDFHRALALFEAALALAPGDLASHVYRAEIRLRQGRADLASPDLRYVRRNGAEDDPFVQRAEQLTRLMRKARRG